MRKKQSTNAILVCGKIPKGIMRVATGERGMEGTPRRQRTAFQKSLLELLEHIHNYLKKFFFKSLSLSLEKWSEGLYAQPEEQLPLGSASICYPVKAEPEGGYFQMILVAEAKGWESKSGKRREVGSTGLSMLRLLSRAALGPAEDTLRNTRNVLLSHP